MGFQFRDLPPGSTAASVAYCMIHCFSKRSYFGRQVPLAYTTRGSPLTAKGGTMGEKWWPNAPKVLLHAANLRHGTDNFTSLPKEGVLRTFIALLKIRRLRPGLNPRTWVSEASTLTLHCKVKVKAIQLQAWTGPEGSRSLRFPDFKTIDT